MADITIPGARVASAPEAGGGAAAPIPAFGAAAGSGAAMGAGARSALRGSGAPGADAEELEELGLAEARSGGLDLDELEELEDLADLRLAQKGDASPVGAFGLGDEGAAELEELEDTDGLEAEGLRRSGAAGEASGVPPAGAPLPDGPPSIPDAASDAAAAEIIADRKMNSFVPNEFLRLMGKRSIMDLKLGDHLKREMTVFFSDIRQFTEIFESISPEEGFKFINSYFTRVVPIITRYGGFVDKYMGDAIMAIFPQSNGADMALRASVEIQKQLKEYNKHRANRGYRSLNIGIGLHTGPIILGVVGTHNRMQNTVISDAVNLASRIEGLTKIFGVAMAISGQTFRKLEHPEKYMFRYLGNVRVKGKAAPTSVYEILNGIDDDLMEKKMRTSRSFEQGLFCFAQKKYNDALDNFSRVLSIVPEDRASAVYSERCHAQLKRA